MEYETHQVCALEFVCDLQFSSIQEYQTLTQQEQVPRKVSSGAREAQ
jgi:hypothetical protein